LLKNSITVNGIRQDEWANPFGASPEELVASALEESGLMEKKTTINGRSAQGLFQTYCKKKSLFQEATRLGSILLKEEIISREQLDQALAIQTRTGRPLGEVLLEKRFCRESDIEMALNRQQAIREDLARLEQAREAKKDFWGRIIRFLVDTRDPV
jgi:hypothetical protein